MQQEKSPAELLLFAHCNIKKKWQGGKKSNKDMEELCCKSVQGNRTRTLDIRDKETTWKAEKNSRQEETNNTLCEILVHDTLV